jgi:hypothetical protein
MMGNEARLTRVGKSMAERAVKIETRILTGVILPQTRYWPHLRPVVVLLSMPASMVTGSIRVLLAMQELEHFRHRSGNIDYIGIKLKAAPMYHYQSASER